MPRTGYHGIVIIKVEGHHVFLCPSYRVEQDITKPLLGLPYGAAA